MKAKEIANIMSKIYKPSFYYYYSFLFILIFLSAYPSFFVINMAGTNNLSAEAKLFSYFVIGITIGAIVGMAYLISARLLTILVRYKTDQTINMPLVKSYKDYSFKFNPTYFFGIMIFVTMAVGIWAKTKNFTILQELTYPAFFIFILLFILSAFTRSLIDLYKKIFK